MNAELLIDHAWGWEPCTIEKIKEYKPNNSSISSGQVLHCAYTYEKTKLIISEMADILSLELVSKKKVTDQIVLNIGYDIDNLKIPEIRRKYNGEITTDYYGRKVPKPAHGTINLEHKTSSAKIIIENALKLYNKIANKDLLIKRINITANNIVDENTIINKPQLQQLDLFTNYEKQDEIRKKQLKDEKEEKQLQNIMLSIKNKYGKNAILKGMNLEEGGTTIDRNKQIGGHRE